MIRYARIVLAKFDTNGDGALSFGEWQAMPGNPSIVDYNGDGRIVVDEILRRMALYGQMRRIILMPSSFLGRSSLLPAGESAPSRAPSTSSGSERPPFRVTLEMVWRHLMHEVVESCLSLPSFATAQVPHGLARATSTAMAS